MRKETIIDRKRFWPAVATIAVAVISVSLNLASIQETVDHIYASCIDVFGWLYIAANIFAFGFALFIAFGPYKHIRLGGADAKPEYSTFAWVAMMFTTSCGAWLVVYGFLEPIYYVSAPPYQITPFSTQAYEYAELYAHYHWGLNVWSLYVPASIAIAYVVHNRKKSSVAMSTACAPVLKKRSEGFLGCAVDVFSTFGAIISPVISLGTGMPVLLLLIQSCFGISEEYRTTLQIAILCIWVSIFSISVYLGLQKGIKNLSNINIVLALLFMLFIGLLVGPTQILETEINTIGLYASNFVRMLTYTDPFGDSSFVTGWTVGYWAVYMTYMPLMGIFTARISKGRTLRELVFGQVVLCSLGCWFAMMTLGNYSLKLQLAGVDIAGVLSSSGEAAAIQAVLEHMPVPKGMMFLVIVLCFIFLATTIDSGAFVAAETTIRHTSEDVLAPRWSRVFWAAVACAICFVLLKIEGFKIIRVMAILTGFPLCFVLFIIVASSLKMMREDCGREEKGKLS